MDDTFLQARIDYFEALIVSIETAVEGLSTDQKKSYTIATGQTTETVTKRDLSALTSKLDWAYQRLDYFNIRRNGGGTIIVRPGC
jgi:hypothetical protein